MSLRGRLYSSVHTVFLACRAVRQISPERAMPHPGHPNFEDCRPRNSGMRVALYYRSAVAEPFGAEGPDAPFGEIHLFQLMAVSPSEHARSSPGRGHAMPSRRQARDVVKIARFVRAFAENRANRGDFHETCLKLSSLSCRGGTGVHAPAPCGWRVLPSGTCGRKKNTPRPLMGPGVACSTARGTAGLRYAAPPRG